MLSGNLLDDSFALGVLLWGSLPTDTFVSMLMALTVGHC